MKKLQILRIDNDLVQKADLQIGNNIITRSVVTGCGNDRIFEHAVTINLSPDNEMTITPVLPCYMKSTESSRWQPFKSGTTISIKPGDVFSLLPDKCWFEVVLVPDTMDNNQEHASKRKAKGNIDCDIPDKKPCSESGEGDNLRSPGDVLSKMLNKNNDGIKVEDEGINANKENVSNDTVTTNIAVKNFKEIHDASSKDENKMHASNSKLIQESQHIDQSSLLEQNACKLQDTNGTTIKIAATETTPSGSEKNLDLCSTSQSNEPVTAEDIKSSALTQTDVPNESTIVATNAFREKCKYGKKCYRRNPQHIAKFSHPVDSDYDIPDDREECPYGKKCYRRNPQHKMQFKHTVTSKVRRKRTPIQAPSDTLSDMENFSSEESAEESVDESEYEPSSDAENSDDDDDDEAYYGESGSEWEADAID